MLSVRTLVIFVDAFLLLGGGLLINISKCNCCGFPPADFPRQVLKHKTTQLLDDTVVCED